MQYRLPLACSIQAGSPVRASLMQIIHRLLVFVISDAAHQLRHVLHAAVSPRLMLVTVIINTFRPDESLQNAVNDGVMPSACRTDNA